MENETVKEEIMNPDEWKPTKNPWLVSIPLMASVFMYALDETISNVALPYMAGSFSCSHNEATWVITFYLIASGIIIPAVDFLCKLFGRKNFFIMSLIIFTFASFLCGISNSIITMVLSRFLQGLGGGAILPLTQAIMMESFPKKERPQAMALFGLGIVFAPIIGPAIGGWITENWSWPYIYYINIPIGFAVVAAAKELLEEPPYAKKQKGVKFDAIGFSFMAIWLVCLQIVLDKGNDADWFGATWICWMTAVSCVAGLIFLITQIKGKNCLIDLSIMKDKNYFFGTVIQIVLMGVMMASSAILPSMLQSMMGYTSFLSGVSMVPRGAGCLAATVLSAIFVTKLGARKMVTMGLIILGIGGLAFGEINLQISLKNIGFPNFLFGLGMVMAMVPLVELSCRTLRNDQMTNASAIQNLLKNVGAAVGTSLVTTCISRFGQMHQNMMVDHLSELNPAFVERLQAYVGTFIGNTDLSSAMYSAKGLLYNQLLQQSTLWAYIDTFRLFGAACFIIIPLLLFMKNSKVEG
jgi:DHA2 family multidrug resistance protein